MITRFIKLAAALAVVALSLSACSTTETVSEDAKQVIDIRKGSSTADLIAALGEPSSIAPLPQDPENVEVWTYEIEKSQTEMIAARTEEIPFFDPITGEMKMLSEPYFSPQTTTVKDTILVYIANEAILGWHVNREEKRSISD